MFLLIRRSLQLQSHRFPVFTFHNVSINTMIDEIDIAKKTSLHSTMFLLIRNKAGAETLKKITLHSTMFLLIRKGEKQ